MAVHEMAVHEMAVHEVAVHEVHHRHLLSLENANTVHLMQGSGPELSGSCMTCTRFAV